MEKIMEQLTEIFQEVFDDDELELTEALTPEDVEGWDSLANMNLIVSIEEEFDIKFALNEIAEMKSVGDIVKKIAEKVA